VLRSRIWRTVKGLRWACASSRVHELHSDARFERGKWVLASQTGLRQRAGADRLSSGPRRARHGTVAVRRCGRAIDDAHSGHLLGLVATALAIALVAAPAQARRSYCAPDGDYAWMFKRGNRIYLGLDTFALRGAVRLCVTSPNGNRKCLVFKLRRTPRTGTSTART